MIEKLPDGRSLRSEFSLVHGEIAEPDAVAPANPFEFGNVRHEFGSRRIHDARDGTLSQTYANGERVEQAKQKRDRDTARQIITQAQQAEMIAVGLKGAEFDKHEVTLSDGRRMALGDIRRALDVVNRDFDGAVEAAIARGDLPEGISKARIDELRGQSMTTQATLDHAWKTGEGFDQRVISEMPPELTVILRTEAAPVVTQHLNVELNNAQPPPSMDF